jgi:catechol 2,3-dioxygenase-like lactoylglutathione lyase family enzyme
VIAGIQQIGLGVTDAALVFAWYRRWLGMDIRIFDEAAPARLMTRYTGGTVHSRRAILAVNLNGGAGFEIWQFTSRTAQPPSFDVELGDVGILSARVKAEDVALTHKRLADGAGVWTSPVRRDPSGAPHFWLRDPWGNLLQVVRGSDWFADGDWVETARRWMGLGSPVATVTGGLSGCLIGVADVERALPVYRDLLGFDRVLYDECGVFDDLAGLPGGDRPLRRVLLGHSAPRQGAFSALLGSGQLELVSSETWPGRSIFAGRCWGDLGFIHLCFDVRDMDGWHAHCAAAGFPFTIDSASSFDMGDAAGRFAYFEDPDGTLIELVETHRLPVLKRLGLYVDLRGRDPARPLPTLLLKALAFNRVR